MKAKPLLILSAVIMGLSGAVASFLPREILLVDISVTGLAPFLLQTMGALYLGFAMMNRKVLFTHPLKKEV